MGMNYRSTNVTQGFGHTGGALVIGIEAGSGVEINPNSSGSAPNIQPVGDETNKGLTIQSKGTGTITLGSSANQPLTITSTAVTHGSGNIPIAGFSVYTIQFTPAAINASTASQSTITVAGLSTTSALFFCPTSPGGLSMAYNFRVQCSTANELRFTQQNITASTIGTGESTARGLLFEVKF